MLNIYQDLHLLKIIQRFLKKGFFFLGKIKNSPKGTSLTPQTLIRKYSRNIFFNCVDLHYSSLTILHFLFRSIVKKKYPENYACFFYNSPFFLQSIPHPSVFLDISHPIVGHEPAGIRVKFTMK